MPVVEEYKVELDLFEGPLDLLLYLIRKDEIDIYNIPIESITRQYMQYLDVMKMLDLNIAGEFIVMAASLMMIKSRMLLPIEERGEEEEAEDEEDPRWELVRQLVEYKKFKDIANQLQERELVQENVFAFGGKSAAVVEPDDPGLMLQDVSLFDLISAFNDVLKNAPPESIGEIAGDRYTVADKIEFVLATARTKRQVKFTSLFRAAASRHEIICTFLALLELLRLRQLCAVQGAVFGEIYLTPNEDPDDPPTEWRPDEDSAGELEFDFQVAAPAEQKEVEHAVV